MIRIGSRCLSPTAVNTYLSCPRKYFLRYIRKLRGKPSIHLIRGSAVHKAIDRFHKEQNENHSDGSIGKIKIRLLELFEDEWFKAKPRLDQLEISPGETEEFRTESRQMMTGFAAWISRNQSSNPDQTELRLISRNFNLIGIIDALYQEGPKIILVDYKTSRKPVVTQEIKIQAGIYAILCLERFGRTPKELRVHFLIQPSRPVPIPITKALIKETCLALRKVRDKTRSENESDYPCTCGGYCGRDFADA